MEAEAPGSWQHSRAMANLAEAAAASIHADALLTRTGAYYHDLGKTSQAKYYVENLEAGERTPHEDLDPDVSADAIMAHVIEGVRILREGNIPEPVVEFVYTHHGTSVIEYFWHKCLKQGNPKGLTEQSFRYPGMAPRTKETAILMLIDSIEAGARTVEPPTRENFEELVQRVIFTKLKQGQLGDCGLTLQDVQVLTNRIAEALVSIRHNRIRYPWQEEQARAGAAAQAATPAGGSATVAEREPPAAGAAASDSGQDRVSPVAAEEPARASDAQQTEPHEPPR
jgi:putative nucleotidyltransferase with HDIG domain